MKITKNRRNEERGYLRMCEIRAIMWYKRVLNHSIEKQRIELQKAKDKKHIDDFEIIEESGKLITKIRPSYNSPMFNLNSFRHEIGGNT